MAAPDTVTPPTPAAAPAAAPAAPALVTPPAPAPAEPELPPDPNALSPGEQELMNSRGERTELYLKEQEAAPAVPGAPPAAPAPGAPPIAAAGEDEDDDDPLVDDPKAPRRVNYNKYKRATERAKAFEKQLNDLRTESAASQAKVQERLNIINEALQTPQQQATAEKEDPEPDPEQDIFAHNKWLARKGAKLEQLLTQQTEQAEQASQNQRMMEHYSNDAQTFASTNEEAKKQVDIGGNKYNAFALAYNYLLDSRNRDLEAYGIATPAERKQLIANEERDLVNLAMQTKSSPAERVWKLAVARGFVLEDVAAKANAWIAQQRGTPAAPAAAPAPAAAASAAPTAIPGSLAAPPAAAPAAPAAPNVSDELRKVANGQAAAMSLSNAGGSPGDTITPEKLAAMDEEEFAAFYARLPKSQLRSLMGN